MKKSILILVLLTVYSSQLFSQSTKLRETRHYNFPPYNKTSYDSVLSGLESVRGTAVGDLNNDKKYEIVVTNYADKGHVRVFSLAGKDTFELVWSSPHIDVNGGLSSPRNVLIGDLDNDGRNEIIFESANNGVYIYEWNGQPGHTYGNKPSQVVNSVSCIGFPGVVSGTSYVERMELADVDNDGQQELVMAYRGGIPAEQKYMIIKAIGNWETNDPGFSSFQLLYLGARTDLADWGLNGGSPNSMMPANFDGTGTKEILLHAWTNKCVTVLRNVSGSWLLPDKSTGKHYLNLDAEDGVSYFGGLTYDIDKDGRDEVYMPTSFPFDSVESGKVHAIFYDAPSTPTEIDLAKNIFTLSFQQFTSPGGLYGSGYGDIDNNGKPNIYFSSDHLGSAIVTAEFQGGDKKDQTNWKTSVLYYGDTTVMTITIKDSLGRIDTTYTTEFYFPAKIFAKKTDIDSNGLEDIVVPIQPWNYAASKDSITQNKYTWNSTKLAYDTTQHFRFLNPKRHSFVILEKSPTTGIDARYAVFITPEDYQLKQNYPNPFNPSTQIDFMLPLTKEISLRIYDVLGKEVRTLINNERYGKGSHTISWNGRDNLGRAVSSGSYFCKLTTGNVEKTMKMMLLK